MTNRELMDNLDYASQIAKDGANTPLLGGRIGLMWGSLLVLTLLAHGLTSLALLPIPPSAIGFFWLTFGVLGGLLTWVLGRGIEDMPGAHSTTNRVEQATWSATTLMLFGMGISVAISVFYLGKPYWLFDIVLAAAFGTYIINYYVLAKVTGMKSLYMPMIIGFGMMVFTLIFVGQPFIYLAAAFGVLFTAVLPAWNNLRNEPKNV